MLPRLPSVRRRPMVLVGITFASACIMLLWQRQENRELEQLSDPAEVGVYLRLSASQLNESAVPLNLCTGKPWTRLKSVPKFKSSPIISKAYNLLYCPVGKVGSSFFTRLVISLNEHRISQSESLASPLNIPIANASRDRCDSLASLKSSPQTLAFLRTSERLVFGRDPYKRIFSAWVDKLYSPNPFYWRIWGTNALRLSHVDHKRAKGCNADVTFRQFVKLVVHAKGLYRSDVHLRPVAEECRMCDLAYTLVGKMERTSSELDILASRLNVTIDFHKEPGYELEYAMDAVKDAVASVHAWRGKILHCGISLDRVGKSVWRKMQIRGMIDRAELYPFRPEDTRDMLPSMFIEACHVAIERSQNSQRLHQQKEAALLEAYSQVDPNDLAQIAERYHKDFTIFGYDTKPHYLFGDDRPNSVRTGAFDWETLWVL